VKTLWYVISIILLVHAIAFAGAVVWLKATDRLSRDRVYEAVAVFRPTLAKDREARELKEREALAAEAVTDQREQDQAALVSPATLDDRVARVDQNQELLQRKNDLLQAEIRAMTRNLELAREELSRRKLALEEEKTSFEALRERQSALMRDEGFQSAVKTVESLRPRQVKAMFQQMLAEGRERDVVDLLGGMDLRKRAAVLGEFKAGEEAGQAADLLQRLRDRGLDAPSAFASTASDT